MKWLTNMTVNQREDAITWFTFNNILPLIFTAVSVTTTFMMIQQKLALIDQRLTLLIQEYQEDKQSRIVIMQQIQDHESRIVRLEDRSGLSKK